MLKDKVMPLFHPTKVRLEEVLSQITQTTWARTQSFSSFISTAYLLDYNTAPNNHAFQKLLDKIAYKHPETMGLRDIFMSSQ